MWTRLMRPANRRTALVIIDVQNDFISGSLALSKCPAKEDGAAVVPVINELRAKGGFDRIFVSKDWHPQDHVSFIENIAKAPLSQADHLRRAKLQAYDKVTLKDGTEQTLWPAHCVQNTAGAELHPDLITVPSDTIILKGIEQNVDSYSAFYDNNRGRSTGLADMLRSDDIDQVMLCGLALDVCVGFSALDCAEEGFDTYVLLDACRGIDVQGQDDMKQKMKERGIRLLHNIQPC
eukprot:TRINITY_DN10621_c0_g1_i3.p1 TRINITY_DN10621_c0_g1~~TRINITY_DN10621_c0_g1_i3.p1  ORF type:complete len:235 (+),score=49.00 TRINITY_DN10621_c0_g1_i3:421-1125(+)